MDPESKLSLAMHNTSENGFAYSSRCFPKTPIGTANALQILHQAAMSEDWVSETSLESSSRSTIDFGVCTPGNMHLASSGFAEPSPFEDSTPNLHHMQNFSFSRSAQTYTCLSNYEIRPCRGTKSPSTSPCRADRRRISRQRLQNLPRLSIVVFQACRRRYEGSAEDHVIEKHARFVCNGLEKQRYDFISFLIASREALSSLVLEGIVSLPLLALLLERMAEMCRLQPLRSDFEGVPSDEQAALMLDRWVRRTSEIKLDGTIEVATTVVANKACRSLCKGVTLRRAGRLRGHSSRQCRDAVPVAKDGLPITARVHYSDRVDTLQFDVPCNSVQANGDADASSEAPTPARFSHFGQSPKSLLSSPQSVVSSPQNLSNTAPTSIFELQDSELIGAPSPARWNHMGSVVMFLGAQAA
jgi:hypothetical protein